LKLACAAPACQTFEDPAAIFGNERVGSRAMVAQCPHRARFVKPHQSAVGHHVGGENGGLKFSSDVMPAFATG